MKKTGYFDPWTVRERLGEGWGIKEIADAYGYHRKDVSEVAQAEERQKSKETGSGLKSFAIMTVLLVVLIWLVSGTEWGQYFFQTLSEPFTTLFN